MRTALADPRSRAAVVVPAEAATLPRARTLPSPCFQSRITLKLMPLREHALPPRSAIHALSAATDGSPFAAILERRRGIGHGLRGPRPTPSHRDHYFFQRASLGVYTSGRI